MITTRDNMRPGESRSPIHCIKVLLHNHSQQHGLAVQLLNLYHKSALAKCRAKFLSAARKQGIIPNFINGKMKIYDSLSQQDTDLTFGGKILRAKRQLSKNLLNTEIDMAYHKVRRLDNDRHDIETEIEDALNTHLMDQLRKICLKKYKRTTKDATTRQKNKLNVIKQRLHESANLPTDFVTNLSDVELPVEVKIALGLGRKFAYPSTEPHIIDMLVSTDNILEKLQLLNINPDEIEHTRNVIMSHYINHIQHTRPLLDVEKYLLHCEKTTKQFFKQHKDLSVIPSDKGQMTVVIPTTLYHSKLQEHLSDTSTYKLIPTGRTPKSKAVQKLNNLLVQKLHHDKQLSDEEKCRLISNDPTPHRIYATIKVHKPGAPVRPIVSTVNGPTSAMSRFLNEIISTSYVSPLDIENSSIFLEKLKKVRIESDESMFSIDVVSMYTNILQEEAINITMEHWDAIKTNTRIPKERFREMLTLCVTEGGFFLYGDHTYTQIKGLAMGNPLSGTLAGIVLDKYLHSKLQGELRPKFTTKYVDDLFNIGKTDDIGKLLDKLNSGHPTLKFTTEEENGGAIPYLDVMIIRQGRKLITDWYCKPSSTNRLLNYHSAHSPSTIYNVGLSFSRRVIKHSHPKFHTKNYTVIHRILAKNGYPKHIIKRIIKQTIHHRNKPPTTDINTDSPPIYLSLPYVPYINARIKSSIDRISDGKLIIASKPFNQGREKFFSNMKTKINSKPRGLIYKILCKGNDTESCDKVYIGETGNDIHTRTIQHKSNYRCAVRDREKIANQREQEYASLRTRNRSQALKPLMEQHKKEDSEKIYTTQLLQHAMHHDHLFDYENTKLQKLESNIYKRRRIESMFIHMEGDKAVNHKRDTRFLHTQTKQVLNTYVHRYSPNCESRTIR